MEHPWGIPQVPSAAYSTAISRAKLERRFEIARNIATRCVRRPCRPPFQTARHSRISGRPLSRRLFLTLQRSKSWTNTRATGLRTNSEINDTTSLGANRLHDGIGVSLCPSAKWRSASGRFSCEMHSRLAFATVARGTNVSAMSPHQT